MPAYGTVQAGGLTCLFPGTQCYLFKAETISAPESSIAVSVGGPPGYTTATFQIIFASAPTAVVNIQASMVDVDADYVTLFTSTNQQFDSFSDVNGGFKFYRANVASQ